MIANVGASQAEASLLCGQHNSTHQTLAMESKMKLVKSRNINPSEPLEAQIGLLDYLIKNAPETSRIVEFSPELAEYILTNLSHKNRPRKSMKIIQYSRDMSDNKWLLTGETIAFGTDGVGTKVIVAELLGRYDTIGIDCVAMNVNDMIWVGARYLSMVDYIDCSLTVPK